MSQMNKGTDAEMQNPLIAPKDLEGGYAGKAKREMSKPKKSSGIMERIVMPLEERYSLKKLSQVWGPKLEFIARLMLVGVFLDDSLRTAMNFSNQIEQIDQGWHCGLVVPAIVLGIGLISEFLGALCLITLRNTDGATIALIGWTIVQPVLYGQLSNVQFVTESLSLLGGLLMLRAHLVFDQAREGIGARTQLIGRLLLPAMYLYYAWRFILTSFAYEETSSVAMFISSLSMFVINAAMIVGFMIGSAFLFFGLKSRFVALMLALINIGVVFYQHPFFRYIWYEGGEWKYDEDNMPNPSYVLPSDVSPLEVVYDATVIYDLHRYYFFMGLSTSGALLLLAQFGPGEYAVQKAEVLLPRVRAQD